MNLQSLKSTAGKSIGAALFLLALTTPSVASSGAPEIDPGMIPSALVILVGGVLALKGRRRPS
jgi:hypothetical protein